MDFPRRPKVYIAGPFRADTPEAVRQNIGFAREAAIRLLRLGYDPIVPHCIFLHAESDIPDDRYLEWGLNLQRDCGATYLLRGWRGSHGALKEKQHAEYLGQLIFEEGISEPPER